MSADALIASPSLASIWRFAPVISYLHLRNLAVDITFFGDGKYSFSDLIGSKQPAATEEPKEEGVVFPFALYGFEMTNATIVFDDRPHDKRHVISDLNLMVPFTSSFQSKRKEFTQPTFNAVVNGDPIELKGRTLPFDNTLRTEFELGAVNVDLDQYWRYVPIESPLKLTKGKFTSDISFFFERPDAQRVQLFVGGGGTLTDLELTAPDDGTVLALKELDFEMERYSLGEHTLVLNEVTMSDPYFKVIRRGNNAINWAGYFPGSEVTEKGAEIKEADSNAALLLDIRSLQVKDGMIEWMDRAVAGGFTDKFTNLNVSASEISTHGDKPCAFDASIGGNGRLEVKGSATLSPLAAEANVTAGNIQLSRYQTYWAEFLPLQIKTGKLGLSASLTAKDVDGKPAFSLHSGSVTLDSLALHKPDSETPSLGLTKFAVSGVTADVNAQTLVVDAVTLDGPKATIVREKQGTIDLARLFAGQEDGDATLPTEDTQTEETPQASSPWVATIKSFKLAQGEVALQDVSLKQKNTLSLHSIQGEIKNITTKKGEKLTHDIGSQWAKKGELNLKGEFGLDTLKGTGKVTVRSLALRPFDSYLGEFSELLFASGTTNADLGYVFDLSGTPTFKATGAAGLHRVKLKDGTGKGEFAGIEDLKLTGITFSNEPYKLRINSISLDGPHAAIDFDESGRLNIRRVFRIPEPPPVPEVTKDNPTPEPEPEVAAAAEQPKPEVQTEPSFFDSIEIGKITMTNGHVSFRDATVSPIYMTEVTDMKLGLVEVDQSPDARPKMDFRANIGPTPVSVTGALNPVITPLFSDLVVAVNGLEMVPLSPYTIQYLAYPIVKGRLYADVNFKTEDWVLVANNKFFVEQLELGPKDKRPDAPNVPVKFGLALLQDGNGDLELDLPIRGRLDDPDFRIGGIVMRTIVSLFFKALTSPFSLIGSIFTAGGEDMDFVVFQPGRHQLDPAGMLKLENTVKMLKERPRLDLSVDGVIDPIADKKGLVEVIFENKLKQQKYNSLSRKERAETTVEEVAVAPEEYEEMLYEAYADEPDEEGIKPTTLFMTDRQPVEVMEKFILDRIVITEEDLQNLAMQRARTIKDQIIKRDAELTDRVFLMDNRKDRKGKVGVPKHRADLGIK